MVINCLVQKSTTINIEDLKRFIYKNIVYAQLDCWVQFSFPPSPRNYYLHLLKDYRLSFFLFQKRRKKKSYWCNWRLKKKRRLNWFIVTSKQYHFEGNTSTSIHEYSRYINSLRCKLGTHWIIRRRPAFIQKSKIKSIQISSVCS